MESIKILVVEKSTHRRDYLTGLVQIIGYHAHAVKGKREFMAALHRYNPDLLLFGSSNHAGYIKAFAEVMEREKVVKIPGILDISSISGDFDSADLKQAIRKLVEESQDPVFKELDKTIVGQTPVMMQIKRHILRLSKSDATILITGETGTGKELFCAGNP